MPKENHHCVKPPRVLPNTYWTRKGGGWILEYKRKVKHKWQYAYLGLLDLDTWNSLRTQHTAETLAPIIRDTVVGPAPSTIQFAPLFGHHTKADIVELEKKYGRKKPRRGKNRT
ncbi:MAG: hypothetical protein ACRD9Y_18155 [Blastocatellia bacterium]